MKDELATITLADWLAVRPDYGEGEAISELFRLRPDWIHLGDLESRVLCRFEHPNGQDAIWLEHRELTFVWGDFRDQIFYQDFDQPPARAAEQAIEWIEGILSGQLVFLTIRNTVGGGSLEFVDPQSLPDRQMRVDRCGYTMSVKRWLPEA